MFRYPSTTTDQSVDVWWEGDLWFPHVRRLIARPGQHQVLRRVEAQRVDGAVVAEVLQQTRAVLAPPDPSRVVCKTRLDQWPRNQRQRHKEKCTDE